MILTWFDRAFIHACHVTFKATLSSPEPSPQGTDAPDHTAEGPTAPGTAAGNGASPQASVSAEAGLGTGEKR